MEEGEVIFKQSSRRVSSYDDRDMMSGLETTTIMHGDYTSTPLTTIEGAYMFSYIRKGWNDLGLVEATYLQKAAWPQIVRGSDCFLVGPRNSGKSLAYLGPICAMLQGDIDGWKQLNGKGPVAVILTHNTYSSIKIDHYCQVLLSSKITNQLQCTAITEYSPNNRKLCSKGVEIIVTTPELFLQTVGKTFWMNLDRLKFFVIDDVHYTLRTKKDIVTKVLATFVHHCDPEKNIDPQIVICGTDWNKNTEDLYWNMPRKSVVIIGNSKAVIPYSRIKCAAHCVESSQKCSKLLSLLDATCSNPFYNRVIVACGSSKSCEDAYAAISNSGRYPDVKLCNKFLNPGDIKGNRLVWNRAQRYDRVIMVFTDEVLKYFEERDANYLIHFDIEDLTPEANKQRLTAFYNRFLCLRNLGRNISDDIMQDTLQRDRAVCDILITTKEKDLDRIVKTFIQIGIHVPSPVMEISSKIRKEKESQMPLCHSIKLKGICDLQKLGTCRLRHTINMDELRDTNAVLPGSGSVEIFITKCTTVSSYIGRIIRYFPQDGYEILDMQVELEKRNAFLTKYLSREINRCPPGSIAEGELCAVKLSGDDVFTRAKILQILTRSYSDAPDYVRVFCIDTGETVIRKAQIELFMLPDEMEDLPYLSVEAILVGAKPPNDAAEYSSNGLNFINDLIGENVYKAKICMSMGNTIWISWMRPINDKDNLGKSVLGELLNKKHASMNQYHEHWIWTITSRGSENGDRFFSENFYKTDFGYDWAFTKVDSPETPHAELVSITHVVNPDVMYGNLEKFSSLLKNLYEDINVEVDKLIKIRYQDYKERFLSYYSAGMPALVKENNGWHRCVITEIIEGSDVYDMWGELRPKWEYTSFSVFKVDQGKDLVNINTENMFPILTKFVKKLPFQTLCFGLSHIVPVNGDKWQSSCLDYLKETLEGKTLATPRKVHVVFLSMDDDDCGKYLPPRIYRSMVFISIGPNEEVGEELVKSKFAIYAGDGEILFDKVKSNLTLAKAVQEPEFDDERDEKEILSEWDKKLFDPDNWQIDESEEGGDSGWDVYLNDTMFDMYKDHLKMYIKEVATPSIKDTSESNQPSLKDAPVTVKIEKREEYLHPQTFWKQTPENIVLTINLPDIKKYNFEIGKNRYTSFRTINPPNYGFDFQTFGFLKMEEEKLTGMCLQIKLKKAIIGIWPSLQRSYAPSHWLKSDPNAITVDELDDDSPKSKILDEYCSKLTSDSDDSDCDEVVEMD